MKYILATILIILMIGIYIYAHVHRYQIFIRTFPEEVKGMLIKYDNWTDRTFILFYPQGNRWLELRELSKQEKEKLKK